MRMHRLGCSRSRTMGDPVCAFCRRLTALRLIGARVLIARSVQSTKLKPTGAAHRDRLIQARSRLHRSES